MLDGVPGINFPSDIVRVESAGFAGFNYSHIAIPLCRVSNAGPRAPVHYGADPISSSVPAYVQKYEEGSTTPVT